MNNIDFKIDVDDRLLRADHAGGKLRRVIDTYRETVLNTVYIRWVSTDAKEIQIQEISKKIDNIEESNQQLPTERNPEEKHELLHKTQEKSKIKQTTVSTSLT